MLILFVQMISYDATLTRYVPHGSFPCRHTVTIALTDFDKEHSRACSVSTHRILPYGQDRPPSDAATSAACLRNVWFQHDGAPAHKTSSVKQYLVEEFGGQIIGYGGFQKWPPRRSDQTPIDFFLWGYLKHQVYATPPPTLQDLQRRITDVSANVTPAMLHRVQREIHSKHLRPQGVFLY
ncbi:hypothetical protein AVEN_143283-1 [Araneus ventricosus]|uniref:Tc1-like transposase DDE domain-containing protein n=1 Tax=Araneus ventricosus TaxID=182803 RepID=A0A4Y2ADV7_ARAVE|nr:hypothetical protein AVEN_143283-1 [Araneus ventricosus]